MQDSQENHLPPQHPTCGHKIDSFPGLGQDWVSGVPHPQVLIVAQGRKRSLVSHLPQSKMREGTGDSWAQLSLEHVPGM